MLFWQLYILQFIALFWTAKNCWYFFFYHNRLEVLYISIYSFNTPWFVWFFSLQQCYPSVWCHHFRQM